MISIGFAIGGDLFDDRFVAVWRAKLGINMSPDKEAALLEPFVEYFHTKSKPQWPDDFEEEEYPFHVGDGRDRFVLTE
jgi:hypothetical protein